MNPVLEDMILMALGLFVFWQVVLPIIRERPIFPLFRRKVDAERKLKDAKARHDRALAELEVAKLNAKTTEVQVDTAKIEAKTDAKAASASVSKKKETDQ